MYVILYHNFAKGKERIVSKYIYAKYYVNAVSIQKETV